MNPVSPKSPSPIWYLVERSTRCWAYFPSLLSIPRFTTTKPRGNYAVEGSVYATRRDCLYAASGLVGSLLLIFPSWWSSSSLFWWIVMAISLHQVIEFAVVMIRIPLFGQHDQYDPTQWDLVDREKRERTVIVIVALYIVTILWFAVIYVGINSFEPQQFVTPDKEVPFAFQSLVLSFTTQTTIGYGTVAPLRGWAIAATGIQSIVGILYIALAVSGVLNLMLLPPNRKNSNTHDNPS